MAFSEEEKKYEECEASSYHLMVPPMLKPKLIVPINKLKDNSHFCLNEKKKITTRKKRSTVVSSRLKNSSTNTERSFREPYANKSSANLSSKLETSSRHETDSLKTVQIKEILHKGFKCERAGCNKIYKLQSSLYNHRKYKCLGKKFFKCGYCDSWFFHKASAKLHCNTKHPNLELNILQSKEGSEQKKNTRKNSLNKTLKCGNDGCNKAFKHKTTLIRHIKHECLRKKHFKCEYCDHSSNRKDHLKNHYITKHSHLEFNILQLKKGSEQNEDSMNKGFICEKAGCNKVFKHQASLYNHSQYECLGIKSFKCEHCDHSSNRKENLKKHCIAKHSHLEFNILQLKRGSEQHKNSMNKGFKCEKAGCNKAYKHQSDLVRHIKYECLGKKTLQMRTL